MPLSTDVRLSVNVRPQFPKRCIVCSGPKPDARIDVGDILVGWFSFFTDIPEGWGSVTVPIHRECKKPFRWRRWSTRIFLLALVFFLYWMFGEYLESLLPRGVERIGTKIALLVMLIPVVVIEILYPPRFDFTMGKYYVDFQFADPRYAAAFAKRNNELQRYEEIRREIVLQGIIDKFAET